MDWTIFMFGCMGAAAPEVIRMYKIRTKRLFIGSHLFYIIISICFLLLGGIVAVILPTVTPWGAFYAGVSLPIIISGAFGKPSKPPKPPRSPDTAMSSRNVCTRMVYSAESSKFNVREYLGKLSS